MTVVPPSSILNASSEAVSRVGEFEEGAARPPPAAASALVGPYGAAATLTACEGRNARIECDGHVSGARIAFGCTIRPEPGDRVLTCTADGTVWIVSVLERCTGAPARLWTEGDLAIASVRGDISLTAAREITVDAGSRVRVAAPEIDLHAGHARFVFDELLLIGRRAHWYVAKIRSVGEVVETFVGHMLTRARRASRFVEDSDQLRAGDIDHRAGGTLQMRAETMFMTADTVVRVDADQIHMG
jgi:hypothetical protein